MHSQIIERLKASGIFDQFRKECIADVDTKPAYINLHSRVVQSVDDYLKNVHWSSKLVRFGVREGMRKQIVDSSYFQKGVDRIVNQTVDPKINTSFFPVIENAVYEFLGVQKPCGDEPKEESEEDKKCWVQPMDIDPPQESNEEQQDIKPNLDMLPNQFEDIKPATEIKLEDEEVTNEGKLVIDSTGQEGEKMEEEDDEEESPPFEAIGLVSPPHPIPGTSTPLEEIQTATASEGVDIQVTDFTNCFAKPVTDKEQLSNDSSDIADSSVFVPNPPSEKKDSKSSSNKESSSKDRSSSSSSSKKSSDKDKDKPSSSSNKDRSSSSSHSHSKSKSKHRDHSSSRDKDKNNYSDKSNDRDKDRSKKESSSSKYKSSSDSKHSRSSHSSSSRRHSSTSHSKDNRSSSDKGRTSDEKSSSKYKEKDSKASSSHKESSRSHSSSSKDHDKNKHSSSSSRKSSSSRSGHDHKSSKSKSSSKYEKSDSHRSSDESSNKAKSYQIAVEELPYPLPPQPPPMDSPPSIQEQMSPDVNEGGLDTSHDQFHGSSSPKIMPDHEESALDRWYGSGIADADAETTGELVSFSNSKLEPPAEKVNDQLPEDMEIVSSNSTISDQENNSNCYAYSPTIPCQSEVQLASGIEEPCSTGLLVIPTENKVPEVIVIDAAFELEKQKRQSKTDLINSLRDITLTSSFIERRKYLIGLMDPFYDEEEIPVSPPSDLPKPVIVIENCDVNDLMIEWLQREGARVLLQK
ncbi:unnamed protein product [Allacma fusca]|uniref:BOD1/SHG1 domain-containing protein n=1 Tax=Allacma fusca TaxID=39272 RepID=A0A8J2NXD9_9HEXA|nr:unnamed protein product [Allacma fusca]